MLFALHTHTEAFLDAELVLREAQVVDETAQRLCIALFNIAIVINKLFVLFYGEFFVFVVILYWVLFKCVRIMLLSVLQM
jgi:hypothetical protein